MDVKEKLGKFATRLLDYIDRDTTHQAPEIFEIPSTEYSDPALYAVEIDRVFKRCPQFLGLTIEIPNPGDFKTADVVGVPILVTRTADGKVHAFLNACRHRGAPLAQAACGNAKKFTCPYHAWTYRNDGSLAAVPDLKKFGEFDLKRADMIELPCEERAGIIFGMLDPTRELDLDGFFGDMLGELEAYGFESWTLLGKDEASGGNWKAVFDGYMETYHTWSLHRDTVAKFTLANLGAYESYGPSMRASYANVGYEQLRDTPTEEYWTKENKAFRVLNLIFPNVAFSTTLDVAQVSHIQPSANPSESRTILYHLCRHAPQDDATREDFAFKRALKTKVLRDEDYPITRAIQRSVDSGIPFNIMFGRNEPANQHFHKWVRYYRDMDGQGPEPVMTWSEGSSDIPTRRS